MKALLITVDGERELLSGVEPENKKSFQLEELYKLLNCETVELLRLGNGRYLIIDEEGKLKPNAITNETATSFYKRDIIVGNALICDKKQFK